MNVLNELKKAYKKICNPWFRARSQYIKYCDKLPLVSNCILLESQLGTEINGNIFYILKFLSEDSRFADWDIYVSSWIRHQKRIASVLKSRNIQNVKIVTYASDQYFRLLASAKYLVNDNTFDPSFIKKEGQVYLNTWHGTPLKTLGRKMNVGGAGIGNAQKNFIASDYILFPNETTRNAIMVDYMVENLTETTEIYGGYPRNTAFFDYERKAELQEVFNPNGNKIYAYMPTFRGSAANGGTDKNDIYLKYFLWELDRQLTDTETLYVNIHPVARKNINFKQYAHIKAFPAHIETYEFLNIADCLITDYSSVFFDFANTRRKIILFTYDQEDYLVDRGLYMELDALPFPKVKDVPTLLQELRSPKSYDDTQFMQTYCSHECREATELLCDFVFLDKSNSLGVKKNTPNGKENVIIYTGNLAQNGITVSLENLLGCLDLEKRNYYLAFKAESVKKNERVLKGMPPQVNYISMLGDMNLTIADRIIRKLFKNRWISARRYVGVCGKRIRQDWLRCFAAAPFSTAIQFNGYESEIILLWSQFSGKKIIYVHSDMVQEIKMKGNQRRDVLRYAYRNYDRVAIVTQDMFQPTCEISGYRENIVPARNIIDHNSVLEKAKAQRTLDPATKCSVSEEALFQALDSTEKKFITIGRFSPEKGHERLVRAFARFYRHVGEGYLFIVGGYVNGDCYQKLQGLVSELGLAERVILLLKMPNPHIILRECDYFVLSSFYEGFGLVLAEADILGKPVVSTDIPGPRSFMQQHGGTLVENSEQGIYDGMMQLYTGEVVAMNVDYEAYNQEAVREFEQLLI